MTAKPTVDVSTPSATQIRIERAFAAPRALVFEAHTRPELLSQWLLGPPGWTMPVCEVDLRVGGRFRYVWRREDGVEMGMSGEFLEIVRPERIVHAEVFDEDWTGGPTEVTTLFVDHGGRTTVTVTVTYATEAARDGALRSPMADGMAHGCTRLDALLAARSDGPMVRKVAFTLIPVSDVARARRFYEATLGLVVGMAGAHGDIHWVEYDLPDGGCIAITNATPSVPSAAAGSTVALEVDDLDALVTALEARGVAFAGDLVRGPRCRMRTCIDSEGNAIVLHQLDLHPDT